MLALPKLSLVKIDYYVELNLFLCFTFSEIDVFTIYIWAYCLNLIKSFMKKLLILPALLLFGLFATAQDNILGVWKTIDDETGEPKSHVEIYKKDDGLIYGKIIKLLPAATTTTCDGCPGDMNGKSLIGLDIVTGLKPYKDYYSYGTIINPAGGKEYKCSVTPKGDKLEVLGYIGVQWIGRTQVWHKVN